jgi:hypothetical protein
MSTKRELAVEYFVKALSTGEISAAQRVGRYLAADVEYDTNTQPGILPVGRAVYRGRHEVLEQIGMLWPATPGYSRLGWSEPVAEDGKLKVTTSGNVVLTFSFNERDEIAHVLLEGGFAGVRAQETSEIPLAAKGLINNALANQTPIVVTYVDPEGRPHSSLRGSVCVLSPTQLAIWIRHADGGLPQAIVHNPNVALLYNDRRAGATVNVMGRARVAEDEETRRKVYELCPEVEQTHDPHRHGVAVVIDVTRLQGGPGAGRGNFLMVRE